MNNRFKNIKDWIIVLFGFPLAYVCIPLSCCIRNPAAKVFSEESPDNKVAENLTVGCFSAYSWITCCGCCCGEFGNYGPKDL